MRFIQTEKAPRADATRNRQLLLDTAQTLFRAHGVQNVTMSAVAEVAQVGKGTLYRHFADKAALCIALLDQDMQELQNRVLFHLRQEPDPYKKLYWFLEQVAHYVYEHLEMLCESVLAANARFVSVNQAHGWWWQTIRALLAQLRVEGDIDYLADALYLLVDVQAMRHQLLVRHYDIERIVNGLHATLDRLID